MHEASSATPLVGVVMGSRSDWETLAPAADLLAEFGVPVASKMLRGVDSLLSIVQMPSGVPVATFAIGLAGARNAALFAVAVLALEDRAIAEALDRFRAEQTRAVLARPDPRTP